MLGIPLKVGLVSNQKEGGTEIVRIRFRRPTSAQLQQSGRLLKVADKGNIVSVNIGHL